MSSLAQHRASHGGTGPRPAPANEPRPSDAALAAYVALTPDQWRGRYRFPGGEIVFADAARARELTAAAADAVSVDRVPSRAVGLIDEALRLDYIGALNDGESLVGRLKIYSALGRHEPLRSVELYHIGINLAHRRHWCEAGAVYRAAADLDPLFAWHLNNFAWMAATAVEPGAHAGPLAVALAESACAISGWGCWCFLGTLAAAFARAGDFRRAVAWQRISLHLTPRSERAEAATMLWEFEAKRAYIDHERTPAAGEVPSDEGLAQLDVRELLLEAEALIGEGRTFVQ